MTKTHKGRITIVTGIDTGIGKTVATGLLARWLSESGVRCITMKMVQTGCTGLSEDILEHRKLSGTGLLEEDAMGTTCPYVFSVPCSPHLAARLDGTIINPETIRDKALELADSFDHVLVEGAGGLMVPLNEECTILDMIQAWSWPVIVVTGPKLGSINHTLSTLALLENRGVSVQGLIYNMADSSTTDPRIVDDSRELFAKKLARAGIPGRICDIPTVSCTKSYCVDFAPLFA